MCLSGVVLACLTFPSARAIRRDSWAATGRAASQSVRAEARAKPKHQPCMDELVDVCKVRRSASSTSCRRRSLPLVIQLDARYILLTTSIGEKAASSQLGCAACRFLAEAGSGLLEGRENVGDHDFW